MKWQQERNVCPECGSQEIEKTCLGLPEGWEQPHCRCHACGFKWGTSIGLSHLNNELRRERGHFTQSELMTKAFVESLTQEQIVMASDAVMKSNPLIAILMADR